ncbi:MAG: hypothetical protein GY799_13350 [Desulfobulbaceae bacterium]|nr:hypothetical protein [Desulfobulbaceae bacterium]
MQTNKVKKIMQVYNLLKLNDDYKWMRWAETRRRFSKKSANKFFIGVMLDQGQVTERAWDGGEYFVENYFNGTDDFWGEIASAHHATLKKICQKGYEGKSFAIRHTYNTFPKYLKASAKMICEKYESDVRNVWKVKPQDVSVIYDRFTEFQGIGDALAKMAQFILVREYGVAGGENNQNKLAIKPDILVRRVLSRVGLVESEHINTVITTVEKFNLESPADFDAVTWAIGRNYCLKTDPNCTVCHIQNICEYANE